ncbi:MAG: hypothetical protein R3338_08740, partial [Thermoanaerobaculia bacterium]|nr:hypothetical protein [Thermoanaerobaculia bacterium]
QKLYRKLRRSDLELGEKLLDESIRIERAELEVLESQGTLFGGSVPESQPRILSRISALENERDRLRNGELAFFSFDLHFSSVMSLGGFDLVVGNPPWVRGSKLDPDLRRALRDRYDWLRPEHRSSRSPFPQFELSVLFLEKAGSIVRQNGAVSMLLPGKILDAFYADRCRRELTTTHSLLALDDWTRDKSLFRADTFPVGLTFKAGASDSDVRVTRDGHQWTTAKGRLQIADGAGGWTLVPPDVMSVLRETWSRHPSLSSTLGRQPVMGVKTGANDLFFLDESKLGAEGLTTPDGVTIPWSALTRCVRGRDVRRWCANDSRWMIWPEEAGNAAWKREYAAAKGIAAHDLRLAYVRPEHLGWKVVWKDLATRLEAVVVPDTVEIRGRRLPLIPNQTLYCLDASSLDETYLFAAILNSSLVSALACTIAEPAKDNHFRFFGRTIAALPWPRIRPGDEIGGHLVRLSRAMHSGRADAQHEIDQLVCQLYGVDPDVVQILARWL